MMEVKNMNVQRKMALTAGISLFAMAFLAAFAYGYAFSTIYVAGNPSVTLINLNHSTLLFRFVIYSFTVILILDVVIGWALYYYFKTVDEPIAMLCSWLRLIGAAFLGIAVLNLSSVLQLLNNFPQNELFIMNGLKTFLDIWSLGLLVFSCHLFLVGYLTLRAVLIPKILGWMALFAAFCYLITNSAHLFISDYEAYKATADMVLGLPMALGELALAIWLVSKGGKETKKLSGLQQSFSDSAKGFGADSNVAG